MTVAPLPSLAADRVSARVGFGPHSGLPNCTREDHTTQESFFILKGSGFIATASRLITLVPNELYTLPIGTSYAIYGGRTGLTYLYTQTYPPRDDI